MKKVLALLLVTMMIIGLCACGNDAQNNPSTTESTTQLEDNKETVEESPMNEIEEEVFEALKIAADSFKNPPAMRLVDTGLLVEDDDSRFMLVELQGENSYGGTGTQVYYLHLHNSRLSFGTVVKQNVSELGSKNFYFLSVKKVNDALSKYWKDKGL